MENYNKLWRLFYAIGLIAIAIQQLICADFRPVVLPPAFPAWLPARLICTWIFSLVLIAACIAIILEIKARQVSLILGGVFLLLVLFCHIPYQLNHYPSQLGSWTDPFKCLTLSGGAFIVAGSFLSQSNTSATIKLLEKFIPAGKYFMAVMMVAFGIDHFLYTNFVVTLVPAWIPGNTFWTYFAGTALIAAGLGIILNVKRRLAATLLGVMIFIWFVILHIPRAVADPHSGNGNEWTSVFEALAFSGIAFLIAAQSKKLLK
ncbi:MAG TPA: hypothetical protein VGG71_15855 [Chitinophagaceae bacterium]